MRPKFITKKDVERWDKEINESKDVPKELTQYPIIREICYSGLYLAEKLSELQCPESLIERIQFAAGKASFGNDPWYIHQKFISDYENSKLDLDTDLKDLN